jgi:hypothetical protein
MQSKLTEPACIVSLQFQSPLAWPSQFPEANLLSLGLHSHNTVHYNAIVQSPHQSRLRSQPTDKAIKQACTVQASLQSQLTANRTSLGTSQHPKPANGAAKRAANSANTLNHPTPNGDNLQSQPKELPVEPPTIKQCSRSGSVGSVRF